MSIDTKMSLKRTTLTESQKRALCSYAYANKKKRIEYVNWVEELQVNESTISRILKTGEQRLNSKLISPDIKRHKPILYPELELALKEFFLNYQHRTVLTDALLIQKFR